MPPKKDAAKKKKKEAEPPPVPSEFDSMDTAALKRILLELRTDTDKVARERAQAQVDRDAVERFFDITKKELREGELAILAKEREMELMAENHRVEVKVYQQKVKHLEYEHAHGMRRLAGEEDGMLRTDEDSHLRREAGMRSDKLALKSRVREMEEGNAEAVREMKVLHDKNIHKLRQEFATNLEALRGKYELRLRHLRDDLRLRHKVEVHEVEERKNLHINQLMKAHEEAFAEMKRYYNDITKANLQLIAQLRSQIGEANEKVAANQRLMREIAEQNTRLKDPLERATKDLAELHGELKDAEKDRQSLRYAKGRLASLRGQLAALEREQGDLEVRYAEAERERDELYDKFEAMVRAGRRRLGLAEAGTSRRGEAGACMHRAADVFTGCSSGSMAAGATNGPCTLNASRLSLAPHHRAPAAAPFRLQHPRGGEERGSGAQAGRGGARVRVQEGAGARGDGRRQAGRGHGRGG